MGAHWVQECPTQGDPAFDKKRVRPPVGIPMTRLARSEEGGLVLPGGQMGTLVANEDAFAREILGLPTAAQPPAQQAAPDQQVQPAGGAAQPPLLLLDSKPAAEAQAAAAAAAAPAVKEEPGAAAAAAAPAPIPAAAAPAVLPVLAGEAELAGAPLAGGMPGASFFSLVMHSALLPRGPPDFLRAAFDRDEPLPRAGARARWGGAVACWSAPRVAASRRMLACRHVLAPPSPPRPAPLPAEFERLQGEYCARFQVPPRRRSPPRRAASRERAAAGRRRSRSPVRARPSQRSPPRRRSRSREQRRRSPATRGSRPPAERKGEERGEERSSRPPGRDKDKDKDKVGGRVGAAHACRAAPLLSEGCFCLAARSPQAACHLPGLPTLPSSPQPHRRAPSPAAVSAAGSAPAAAGLRRAAAAASAVGRAAGSRGATARAAGGGGRRACPRTTAGSPLETRLSRRASPSPRRPSPRQLLPRVMRLASSPALIPSLVTPGVPRVGCRAPLPSPPSATICLPLLSHYQAPL